MTVTTPPAVRASLAALRSLLIAVGAVLLALHWDHSDAYKWIIEASAATMIVGPLIWQVYASGVGFYKSMAAAIQAGINLTASGLAVDEAGNVISQFEAGATPPKPVTVETAKEIVEKFAPPTSGIAKS